MRVFITGGTGFIGKHLSKKLIKEGHSVLMLSRKIQQQNSNFIKGDLSNISQWFKNVKKFKPDSVIHLAWEGLPDFSFSNSLYNLRIGMDFFESLLEMGCKKVISIGSCWEYEGLIGKVSENMMGKLINPFVISKHCLLLVGREMFKEKKISFIWVRPFFVYGPGQRSESLIPSIFKLLSQNEEVAIKNPEGKHDYIYVEDLIDAIVSLLVIKNTNGVYNIGSGFLTSNQEILEIIRVFLKDKKNISSTYKSDIRDMFYADLKKISRDTGWKPTVSIHEGVKKTILNLLSSKIQLKN